MASKLVCDHWVLLRVYYLEDESSWKNKTVFALKVIIILVGVLPLSILQAEVSVTDDAGNIVTLEQPAKRIISLAPHIAELLYAAGAGRSIVGTVEYSDYPPHAKSIPRVGSHNAFDLEQIIALKPDLVVVWQSGTGRSPVERLRKIGIPIYSSEPKVLEGIARNMRHLGVLSGTEKIANEASDDFLMKLKDLNMRYRSKDRISVFYQIWHQPLMTVNGKHMISQLLEVCGGKNVFANLSTLAPKVSLESVLAKDPQVIIGGSVAAANPNWKQDWKKWPQLHAVKNGNIFYVNPDHVQRHTPRILQGGEVLCQQLEGVRQSK